MSDTPKVVAFPPQHQSTLHRSVESQCLALGAAREAAGQTADMKLERDKRRNGTQFEEWEAARQRKIETDREKRKGDGESDPR